jgi:hypothetical protein
MISDFLRELLRFVILVLIRPVVRALVAIVSPIYRVLFGSFGDRAYRKLQEKLEHDVRENLAWLFEKYEGKVISNTQDYPRAFDYATVTVSVRQILIRFIRGRGELRVDVAPAHAPTDWQEVGEAINSIDESGQRPPRYYRFQDLGDLLERNLERLNAAFSEVDYGPPRRGQSITRLVRL